MKLKQNKIKTEQHGVISEAKFGISDNDQVHILTILRDKLYSNKIQAFVREYSTNAVDAHTINGKENIPFKAIGPTNFNMKFSVRDFGPGLSEEEVYELYVKYGASTKRNTNDAIGQLGLGCKSAFAYTDSFTINSWHDGTHSIYTAFIDETNVGKVVKLSAEPSDQPSGVMVEIPVKTKDIDTVRHEMAHCYRFFRVKPETNVIIKDYKPVTSGTGWKMMKFIGGGYQWIGGKNVYVAAEKAYAVMGDIGYPLDPNLITGCPDSISALLNSPIHVDFEIGDLSIAANREALEYTALTVGNIKKRFATVAKELEDKLLAELTACDNEWEARKKAIEIQKLNLTGNKQLMINLINSCTKWKHVFNLTATYITFTPKSTYSNGVYSNPPCAARRLSKNLHRLERKSRYGEDTIPIDSLLGIMYADTKDSYLQRAFAKRAELKQAGQEGDFLVLKPDFGVVTKADAEAYAKKYSMTGIPLYSLEAVPYTRTKGTSVGSGAAPSKAVKTSVLQMNPTGWTDINKDRWVPATVDLKDGEGVYVTVDRFRARDYRATDGTYIIRRYVNYNTEIFDSEKEMLWDKVKELQALPKFQNLQVYGFKPRIHDKIGTGWIEFSDLYKKEYVNAVKSNQELYEDVKMYRLANLIKSNFYNLDNFPDSSVFHDQTNPLVDLIKEIEKAKDFLSSPKWTKDNKEKWALVSLRLEELKSADGIVPGIKTDEMIQKVYDRYPMIAYLGLSWDEKRRKDVVDYVNMIDGEGN